MRLESWISGVVLIAVASPLWAQSSSLYVTQPTPAPQVVYPVPGYDQPPRLSEAIAATSLAAVRIPEPKRFALHDLITIVIRESTQTDFEATLETNKESEFDGRISDFPNLNLRDLLNFQLRPSSMSEGEPTLGVTYEGEFTGEGEYSRRESISGRITARVIDIKPNGTLVLEARKFIQSDKETLNLVLTGMCRPEDVSIDNTILSSQIYDLRLEKLHEGELRRTTKKGILTKVLETLFNF